MRICIIAAALLVLAVPAHARMRHDRLCDIVQDKAHAFVPLYDPQGRGHGWRFGGCKGAVFDDNPDGVASLAGVWGSLACGYYAYREGKKLKDVPYKNSELVKKWEDGWKAARKSCETDQLPFIDEDTEGSDH